MPWTRLDRAGVIEHLRAEYDPSITDWPALTGQALAHVRDALLSGTYIAVQDHLGHTFIGTEQEAVKHMLSQAGA